MGDFEKELRGGIVPVCAEYARGALRAIPSVWGMQHKVVKGLVRYIQLAAGVREKLVDPHPHSELFTGAYSSRYTVPGATMSSVGIGFVNGMNTSYEDAYGHATWFSNLAGGGRVVAVHNASGGLTMDLWRATGELWNFNLTRAGQLTIEMLDEFFDSALPWAIFLLGCHSEGAIIVRNVLLAYDPERRRRIVAIPVAGAAYIFPDTCMAVEGLASRRDVVPAADFIGRYLCGSEMELLPPHPQANYWDHDFRSPAYEARLRRIFKTYTRGRE